MSAVLTPTKMSPAEYFAWVQTQQERREYIGGEVFATTGTRRAHNLIVGNSLVQLRQGLGGTPCSVYMVDLKLPIDAASAFVHLGCDGDPRPARCRSRGGDLHPPPVVGAGGTFRQHRQLQPRQEVRVVKAGRVAHALPACGSVPALCGAFPQEWARPVNAMPPGTAAMLCIDQPQAFV